MALPELEKIVALVGRGKAVAVLKETPVRFCRGHRVEDLDPRDMKIRGHLAAATGQGGAYGHHVHEFVALVQVARSFAKISQ